ncbi:hypothetical protein B0H11DRAFT_2284386 [Mycena galericulata]|nr:hypothetical protein B0H11DRAFT_2284386 [Mycena galericulata]
MEKSCWKCGATATPPPLPASSAHDLTALLKSNEAPLDSDIPFIHIAISDCQARVDGLDAQIDDLQAVLAALVQKRDEAADSVRQHRSTLSAFRRTPHDVLCEIFISVYSGAARVHNDIAVNVPPWTMGHICRSWRRSALSYPTLWSCVEISRSTSLETNMIETQLHLSRNAPLEIHWSFGDMHKSDPRLLGLVLAQSNRWRTIYLHQKLLWSGTLDWLRPVQDRLAQLETLVVIGVDTFRKFSSVVFSSAPALRRILLTNPGSELPSPDVEFIGLPWNQITHYRGKYTNRLDVVTLAPNLATCTIDASICDNTRRDPGALLPHLQRLTLNGSKILDRLTAPALHDLLMGSVDLDPLLPFIARSSCTLTRLGLQISTLSSKLIAVLQALPTLVHLSLYPREETELSSTHFFNAMTVPVTSSDSCVCPSLESISYSYPDHSSFPQAAFFAMVQSRSQPHSQRRLSLLRLLAREKVFSRHQDLANRIQIRIQMLCTQGIDAAFLIGIPAEMLWPLDLEWDL